MDKNQLMFIHVGKCAGTKIYLEFNLKQIHLQQVKFNPSHSYILWIRNPIKRFVSAFYYSYDVVCMDISGMDVMNANLSNCISPGRARYKANHDHTFSKEYDELIQFFKTANYLAESLTSDNMEIREKAHKLMNSPIEHIHNGLGWYLKDGEFIEKYHDNIVFVGRVENMKEDVERLENFLCVKTPTCEKNPEKKVRENKNNTIERLYLSSLAISNITNYYKGDYMALEILEKYGFITRETLESYYLYQ